MGGKDNDFNDQPNDDRQNCYIYPYHLSPITYDDTPLSQSCTASALLL